MKISIFDVDEWERDGLSRLEDDHEVRFDSRRLDRGVVAEHADADAISVFIYSDLGSEVLDRFDHLKLIVLRSAGADHVDLDWCRDNGVTVTNAPDYGDRTVAEHVFALLLAISHRVVEAADRTRRGDFSLQGLQGFDLCGRTIGVIGTGGIGRHVVTIARAFGMDVVASDVEPDEGFAAQEGFRYVELHELLQMADVVTLHVPGGESTRHLLGDEEFAVMKPGAVLINTARGDLVDSEALVRALGDERMAAAGLDVLEAEKVVREEAELLRVASSPESETDTLLHGHILLRLSNVIVTPHSAFNTREAVGRIVETTIENIRAFDRGESLNTVSGST